MTITSITTRTISSADPH